MTSDRIFSPITRHRHCRLIGALLVAIAATAGIVIQSEAKHAIPSLAAISPGLAPFKDGDDGVAADHIRNYAEFSAAVGALAA